MPKLPSAADYGLPSAPRPTRGVVDIQPDQAGKGVQSIGENLGRMVEQHIKEMDDTAVRDALTELSYKDTELALGDNGYLKLQQQDALKGDVLKRFPAQYQEAINNIANKLQTKAAREMFTSRAAEDMARFNRGMVMHIASQSEKARETSDLAADQAGLAKVSAMPTLDNIAAVLQDTGQRLQKYASRYLGENGDATLLTQIRAQKSAEVINTAVTALIKNRQFDSAENVLKQYGDQLQAGSGGKAVLGELKERIGAGKVNDLTADLGRKAITMFDKKVPIEDIGKYIESNAGEYEAARVIREAKSMLKSHAADIELGYQTKADELYNIFTNGDVIQRPASAIRKDPRFQDLSIEYQNKLNKMMDDKHDEIVRERNIGRESATRQRLLQEEALQNDPAVRDRVSRLLENPKELADLGVMGIAELKVGKAYTQMLTSARASYLRDAKSFTVPKAKIDEILSVVKDTDLRKQMSVQSQMALQRYKLENPTEIPDEKRIRQIVANTTLLVHDVGTFWDSSQYLLDAKNKGALTGKFLDVQRTVSKGGKVATETVQVPATFAADMLEAHPELTKLQILQLYDTHRRKGGK